jgi:hypothetical protein
MKDCPKCRLANPDGALRCDCGYDFASDTMKQSYLPARERRVVGNTAIAIISVYALLRATAGLYSTGVVPAPLSLLLPAVVIAVILIWRKYLAMRWRKLTWR